ncbi:hypothetical protein CRYO30217_01779 [Parvicella tangerina]|uniref:Uncharacterized protein n=1 Tax=Parvicella tangerina TaxID=2829795 RepID=A0A916NH36_9FLAO|nr:hypothetical protein CRYO30217_01779 [Parvicella tangerina]
MVFRQINSDSEDYDSILYDFMNEIDVQIVALNKVSSS